jgi:anti-sigma B factor antagonist
MMRTHIRTGAGLGHRRALDANRPQGEGTTLRRALRPRGPVHLALNTRSATDETIIELAGELDVLTASRLREEIDQVIRRHNGDVVLDLRKTSFLDSAGLHALLTAQRRLSRRQRALTVVCDPGPVQRAIADARLLGALGVVSVLEAGDIRTPTLGRC